ncbi:MAG: cytochrome P450, partial [Actinobacteria bacterium]|nr:cytochrome P450 [Actinomycetota bacterium]
MANQGLSVAARGDGERVEWEPRGCWEELCRSPHVGTAPVYRSLLERCPVVHIPAEGIPGAARHDFWGVLSFDAVAKVAADFGTFSSVTTDEGPRIVPLQSDPPEHGRFRRILDRYFQPRAVAQLEAELLPFCEEMVEAMVAGRRADYIPEFAAPFPTRALCRFLDLDDGDWPRHLRWVTAIGLATGDGLADDSIVISEPLAEEMMPYLRDVVKARRRTPGDDIVTGMADLEIEGRPLDEDDVCHLLATFMLGGHILPSSAIGSFTLRLA